MSWQLHVLQTVTFVAFLLSTASLALADTDSIKSAPPEFWSMDVERQTPFDVEMVSTNTDGDYKTDQFYISSQPFTTGDPDRVLCTFSRIVKPGVVSPVFVDITGGQSPASAEAAAKHFGTAVLDIEWRAKNLSVRSKWSSNHNMDVWTARPKPTDCWVYAITMGARRVIDYLCEQPEIDSKRISFGGSSFGGWFSLLVAGVDDRVSNLVVIWGAGGHDHNHGVHTSPLWGRSQEEQDTWVSHFDPLLYSANIKAKTIIFIGTNDYSFWSGDVVRQFNAIPTEKRICLLPNYNHGLGEFGYARPDIGPAWFKTTFYGGDEYPTVREPVLGHNKSEYSFEASDVEPITQASLYWSYGNPIWPSRYWIEIPAKKVGKKWVAEIPAKYASMEGCVFAGIADQGGRAVTSRYVMRTGADPYQVDAAQWTNGALWDVDHGISAWRIPGGGIRTAGSQATLEVVGDTGLKITPDHNNGKFELLTNSISLTNVEAAKHKGLRLVIDGQGQTGDLRVSLDRNTSSPAEIEYVKTITYSATASTIDIPWSDFDGPAAPVTLMPFDDLRFEGERPDKSPMVIQSMSYYDLLLS